MKRGIKSQADNFASLESGLYDYLLFAAATPGGQSFQRSRRLSHRRCDFAKPPPSQKLQLS